jgi:hypothetical protein
VETAEVVCCFQKLDFNALFLMKAETAGDGEMDDMIVSMANVLAHSPNPRSGSVWFGPPSSEHEVVRSICEIFFMAFFNAFFQCLDLTRETHETKNSQNPPSQLCVSINSLLH